MDKLAPYLQKIAYVRRLLDWLEDDLRYGMYSGMSAEGKLSIVLGMLTAEGMRDKSED